MSIAFDPARRCQVALRFDNEDQVAGASPRPARAEHGLSVWCRNLEEPACPFDRLRAPSGVEGLAIDRPIARERFDRLKAPQPIALLGREAAPRQTVTFVRSSTEGYNPVARLEPVSRELARQRALPAATEVFAFLDRRPSVFALRLGRGERQEARRRLGEGGRVVRGGPPTRRQAAPLARLRRGAPPKTCANHQGTLVSNQAAPPWHPPGASRFLASRWHACRATWREKRAEQCAGERRDAIEGN